jgi:pyruvate formate lyase activating enzyme
VEEIMADVVRDIPFYKNSGGGMTLSGGEPFMQAETTMALLQAGKREGLHICVETSGFAQAALIQASMPYVDIYLFDYKATRSDAHKYFIGAPNELIVSNLKMLLDTGAKVILRCPMVEGVNDTPEHLEGIAALYRSYPELLGVEIMAYHNMGRDKGIRVGLDEEQMLDLPLTPEPVKTRWIDELHRLGCSIAKIG